MRWVNFIEWHGALLSPQAVSWLIRLSEPHITGCWGYDNLIYSAVKHWSGREPRLGVVDDMVMDIGNTGISSFSIAERNAKRGMQEHACGRVSVSESGRVAHVAAQDMAKYWMARGLELVKPLFIEDEKRLGRQQKTPDPVICVPNLQS